jgi:hypothetical protein
MAITGTPGIGKILFLFYIMWRLANMETTKTVVLHRRVDLGLIYVFRNEECRITYDFDYVGQFLERPTTWYLTDALLQSSGGAKGVTIVVSTPDRKYYSAFRKDVRIAPLHYLPTWSLKELQLNTPLYSRMVFGDIKKIILNDF